MRLGKRMVMKMVKEPMVMMRVVQALKRRRVGMGSGKVERGDVLLQGGEF